MSKNVKHSEKAAVQRQPEWEVRVAMPNGLIRVYRARLPTSELLLDVGIRRWPFFKEGRDRLNLIR
jgi:hypothetical protein